MIPGVETNKRLVMGEGPRTASIVIVGEAPGGVEERLGRPFVGPAGDVLTEQLHKAGIPRSSCYITNVVKERPPKNKITPFLDLSKKHPIMSPEYHKYEEYLKQEIMSIHPNVVVAVGGTALWALCRTKGITKYRGSMLESTLIPGLKVIPTLHPAATLRGNYIWQHFIWFDLVKVKENSEHPWLEYTPREYILEPSFSMSMEYLNECLEKDLVAFDIEIYGTEVSCISFSYDAGSAISIPFIAGGADYFTPPQEADIWRKIAHVLESSEVHHVGHNTTFDSTFLFRKYGIRTSNIHDTMVAWRILYPDLADKRRGGGAGLDIITSIYTDIPYYKDDGKDAIHGRAAANRQFWEYNAKDSIVLMEALPKQLTELEAQRNLATYNRQRSLIEVLTYMTELGVRMDTESMNRRSLNAARRLRAIEEEVVQIAGYDLNVRSPKQLIDYFYNVEKYKPYKNRKTGAPTVDEGALKRLSRKGSRVAELLLDHRKLAKAKGTYFDMQLDSDGRLRCSMSPGSTSSGRLSSSKTIFGTGANMQNQPPIMKKFMKPDEDCIVYNMDLAQAENRIVAYLGPDMVQIDAFETKKDIHSLTASFITPAFGRHMTPDEIREENKLFEQTGDRQYASPIGTGTYSWRYWGKKANHAFNYGQGFKAFSYQVEIPEREGRLIHERYHSAYPGVGKMHQWIQDQLRKDRTLTNLYGRRRMYLDRWGDTMFLEAYSFIPQSSVADKINSDGLLYIYSNQQLFRHVQILNQVHDSITIQIPLHTGFEYHARVLLAIRESLERPLEFRGRQFVMPLDIDMNVNSFKDGHGLKFPTVYKEGGYKVVETIAEYLQDQYIELCSSVEQSS